MAIDNRSHDRIEKSVKPSIADAYAKQRLEAQPPQTYYPSPGFWQDQILYFLMVDRFSNGDEAGVTTDPATGKARDVYLDNNGARVKTGKTPPFDFNADAYGADRKTWTESGGTWCGGNLKGLMAKLGYLKRLGVTAIWVSPVFKQTLMTYDPEKDKLVPTNSYHGYGIQNFLDVDPSFGTRQDLKDLVAEAHRLGIYVVLDIILNHAGDVFQYDAQRYSYGTDGKPLKHPDPRWDGGTYRVAGYRNKQGAATVNYETPNPAELNAAWPDGAVWPMELQYPRAFTRQGRINSWDWDPEYLDGDFCSLKDIDHGYHDRDQNGQRIIESFHSTDALDALIEVYKFWIAFADLDGYRVDTVKHMEKGAVRLFASSIHEFAQKIGKDRFVLIGEITGGRENAFHTLDMTGLDVALGIDDVAEKIEYLPKGFRNPQDYFKLFANSVQLGEASHSWVGQHVVTMFDDHDKVGRCKRRFAGDKVNHGYDFLVPALGLNLMTLGIPCVYYGSEQGFDGGAVDKEADNDRYLRECMFGGPFGSLQSTDRHFFDESHPIYRSIAEIAAIQKRYITLRRGRQYLRPISDSGDDGTFGLPCMIGGQIRSVVPWSRIFSSNEMLCAINTDASQARTAWVTIDAKLHEPGSTLACVYSTDAAQRASTVTVHAKNGCAVQLTVPAAGFVVFG